MAITFNEFYRELVPFRNWVAYKTDLRRLRFTREDFLGFADEKIFSVWQKYNEELDKSTMLSVAKTTLYKLPLHLNAKFGKFNYKEYALRDEGHLMIDEVPAEPNVTPAIDYEKEVIDVLAWGFEGLSKQEINFIKLIVTPPPFVLDKVKNPSKRIPSKFFLEFLDIPINSQNIAKFNNYRRAIFKEVRELHLGVA